MDAIEALTTRRSVRTFAAKPIDRATLEKIVDAGRLAPTARNVQPWEFVVVTDKQVLERVAEMTDYGKFLKDAAAGIAVFCKEGKYYLEDGSAATANILNAAHALGVGACWIAGDKKPYCPKIAQLLGVPEGYKLVALVALGYARASASGASKRPLSEVCRWEKF